ncbi:hypothetical protein [Mycobacteroides salmoniphilum]|uniref:Uncharacterized protein n=1 Tax=Mycobacteroides salmoniphilum TaxID=404941 RepID=A0A4R8T014_9MYCO|nr:hypothetical protein [Mycobacteroides salmoniphilum]TEA09202.1 hypothetical protein CCUG60884_00192 [Mycobacteroides salmoniphilum]
MSAANTPYIFELAASILHQEANGGDPADMWKVGSNNGISVPELQRATAILRQFQAAGTDINEWIRQAYVIDGWLRGYLPLDTPAEQATSWYVGQLADAFYRQNAATTAAPHPNTATGDIVDLIEKQLQDIHGHLQRQPGSDARRAALLAADVELAHIGTMLIALRKHTQDPALTERIDQLAAAAAAAATDVYNRYSTAYPTNPPALPPTEPQP